jgi:hypothetical protein
MHVACDLKVAQYMVKHRDKRPIKFKLALYTLVYAILTHTLD